MSPLRVQTHVGRPARSCSCMYGTAFNKLTCTKVEQEEGGGEGRGDQHGTPECISAHTACPTQRCPCTTGDTLGPHSPITPTTRYYNKDVLHTTPSPLRVQHASMFMHMFLLRSGQFTKLGCLSSTRPMDKIGPHKTTSRKGRGSPLSPSPCLAPLKRKPPP